MDSFFGAHSLYTIIYIFVLALNTYNLLDFYFCLILLMRTLPSTDCLPVSAGLQGLQVYSVYNIYTFTTETADNCQVYRLYSKSLGLLMWTGIQPFLSVDLICSNREQLTKLDRHSALVSGSDLLKHWRATHKLDRHSAILVSRSDLLKHWKATHSLDRHSALLVKGSDLLKH